MSARGRRRRRLDVRPVVVLALTLVIGTVGSRLVDGVLSVLLPIAVGVLLPLVAATVHITRTERRFNAGFAARTAARAAGSVRSGERVRS